MNPGPTDPDPPSDRPHVTAEVAAAYAAGELSDAQLGELEDHIDACTSCRQMVSGAARLAALSGKSVGSAPTVPLSQDATVELLPPGTVVSRYVIDEPLGAGGMGIVYAAHDPTLARKVALKAIRQDLIAAGHSAEELLRREAMAMARLAHPNVVGVHDLFHAEGTIFVAMDLIEGTTLRGWLHERPRTTREILDVFVRAGRGLAAAHDEGIVHRDFKPDNVLCGRGGRVCVSDFGLSRVLEARDGAPPSSLSGWGPTATGLVGTPRYMAPEQWAGKGASALSDQYSYCVSFYEAVHGVLPPSTDSARERDVVEPTRSRRDVPARVRRVLARGLRADPKQRYPSMNALLDDLTRDPAARRRFWLRFGAVLGVIAVAGMLTRDRAAVVESKVCRGGEARLVGVWDDARKAGVERALLATGKPFARDAWGGVHEALDAYADDWVASRADACEATRIRGEQSDEMLDLRMECMDRRLAELRGLVDTFTHADGDVVERALQAAHGLAPAAECRAAQIGHVGRGPTQQDDPAVGGMLGRASALRLAGKYAEAQSVAHSALDAARTGGRLGQQILATYELGLSAHSLLRESDAEPMLFDALALAEKQGSDGLAAKAAVQLGDAMGADGKPDEAERWLRLAAATLERIGGDPELDATLAHTRAMNLYSAGKYRESIEEQERGQRIEETLPPDPLRAARSLNTLAGSYYDLGDLERAEELELKALGLYEALLGPSHPRTGSALFNLGVVAMARGRYEEARAFHVRALATAEGLGTLQPIVAVRASSLGHALAFLGRYDEARRYLDQAMSVAASAPSITKDRLARVYINVAHLARLERRYDDGERYYRLALQTAPTGPHESPDALVGLGRVLLDRGDVRAALDPLERAMTSLETESQQPERAEARLALAVALWQKGDRARARDLVRQAREIYDRDASRESEVRDLEEWLWARGVGAD